MGKMQRDKGSTFERLIATVFRDIWPEARRGIGQARSAKEVPDVDGCPYWPELKHRKTVSIQSAMKQARNDTDGRPPIVVSRDNRGPILVTLELDTFLALCRDAETLRATCNVAAAAAELDTAARALDGLESPFDNVVSMVAEERRARTLVDPARELDVTSQGGRSDAHWAHLQKSLERLLDPNRKTIPYEDVLAERAERTGTGGE
jgi:hypothetical protein